MFFSFPTKFPSFWRHRTQDTPKIFTLPHELLAEIMTYTRHLSCPVGQKKASFDASNPSSASRQDPEELEERAIYLPTDLASLSATSRLFRSIALPLMLKEVHVTSASRLRLLALLPLEKLALIRSLSIHLDFDFFTEFSLTLDAEFRTSRHILPIRNPPTPLLPSHSLMHILCLVLASACDLESFSIRLAKASTRSSAWRQFSFRSRGLSLRRTFVDNMCMILVNRHSEKLTDGPPTSKSTQILLSRFAWPRLTHIHLDALQDIAPLLKMAPALSHLSLRMIEGFDAQSCGELIADMQSAFESPNRSPLKSLAFSARSLHLHGHPEGLAPGAELLARVGKACPELESLDLRVHAYSHSVLPYLTIFDRSSLSTLVTAMPTLPNLRTLHFPGNLYSQEEMDRFFGVDERVLPERRVALQQIVERERDAITSMAAVSPHLRNVSWVRKKETAKGIEECSVLYKIHRRPNCVNDSVLYQSVPEVDHVDLTGVNLPPRVHEISRNICSPVVGPSLFGYPRTLDGLAEYWTDHPITMLSVFLGVLLGIVFLICTRFSIFLHIVTVTGLAHMAYMKSFSMPLSMLGLIDLLSHKLTKKFIKEVGKRAPVVVF